MAQVLDPDYQDYIEMLQHSARSGDINAKRLLQAELAKGQQSVWGQQMIQTRAEEKDAPNAPMWSVLNPNMVTPSYTGSTVPGRQTVSRPVGMTDRDVYELSVPWRSRGSTFNFVPRQVTSQVSRGVAPQTSRPEAQAYADLQRWRSAQDRLRAMGGTFSRGIGMGEGPQSGNIRTTEGGGWLQYGPPMLDDDEMVSAGTLELATQKEGGPIRDVHAEEGPTTKAGWLSTAAEMIAAASPELGSPRAFKAGGGQRNFERYQVSPKVTPYASPYLRPRREDER